MTLAIGLPGPDHLEGLGLRAGMACLVALRKAVPALAARLRLKWPNDIYLDGRKCAGLLIEVVGAPDSRTALIGVGVNANNSVAALGPEVAVRAASLAEATEHRTDLDALLGAITRRLLEAIAVAGLPPALLAEARTALFGVGAQANIRLGDGSTLRGELIGLNDSGTPIVRTARGVVSPPPGCELTIGGQ